MPGLVGTGEVTKKYCHTALDHCQEMSNGAWGSTD